MGHGKHRNAATHPQDATIRDRDGRVVKEWRAANIQAARDELELQQELERVAAEAMGTPMRTLSLVTVGAFD